MVKSYIDNGQLKPVRAIQNEILSNYAGDFSKHAPYQEVPRISMVWQSILGQLSRENKKFIYGVVKKGGRANDFELAIQWLMDCGIVTKVSRIRKASVPLKFYEDLSAFKLFFLDLGLLAAMSEAPADLMLVSNSIFEEFKGMFTEQYVLQQMVAREDLFIYYWSSERNEAELDFVIQKGSKIIPIEVKAEENVKAKSLNVFVASNPGLHGVRLSMSDYREQDWLTNIPLFCVLNSL